MITFDYIISAELNKERDDFQVFGILVLRIHRKKFQCIIYKDRVGTGICYK